MSIYFQNHGIAKPIGGGINQTLLDRLNAAENEIQLIKEELTQSGAELEAIKTSRATENAYGLAKISGATTVTEDLGLILSAKEKNASVSGTLASAQEAIKKELQNLSNVTFKIHNKTVKNSNEALEGGVYSVFMPSASDDIPFGYGVLVVFRAAIGYTVQIGKSCVAEDTSLYIRTFDNNISWSPWRRIESG